MAQRYCYQQYGNTRRPRLTVYIELIPLLNPPAAYESILDEQGCIIQRQLRNFSLRDSKDLLGWPIACIFNVLDVIGLYRGRCHAIVRFESVDEEEHNCKRSVTKVTVAIIHPESYASNRFNCIKQRKTVGIAEVRYCHVSTISDYGFPWPFQPSDMIMILDQTFQHFTLHLRAISHCTTEPL